jgi:hypothetical protein
MPGHDQLTLEPTREIVHAYASEYTQPYPAIINLEHWLLPQQMDKYIRVIDWWREVRPDVRVGYYSMLPLREYWAPIVEQLETEPDYVTWWKQQNALMGRRRNALGQFDSRGLVDVVDFICPSLYTFYNDKQSGEEYSHDDWWCDAYAPANIAESRKYQKQVYPFLWPRYHDSNSTSALEYIGDDLLRRQIEVCLKHADGCVIWDALGLPNEREILEKTSNVMREFI